MKSFSDRGFHDSAAHCVHLPRVPALRDIIDARWAHGKDQILEGVGAVGALDTSGGGQCGIHGMLGVPDDQCSKYFVMEHAIRVRLNRGKCFFVS